MPQTHQDFIRSPQPESQLFRKACELAGTLPTRRQASKWRRKIGIAYHQKNAAARELDGSNAKSA